jgi:hypothetical protein
VSAEDLAARVAQLEDDRDRLVDLLRGLVGTVTLLAGLAGADMADQPEPARPTLRLVRGGRS